MLDVAKVHNRHSFMGQKIILTVSTFGNSMINVSDGINSFLDIFYFQGLRGLLFGFTRYAGD